MHLPEYTEWWASGAAAAHLNHEDPDPACPGCAVRPLVADLHAVYFGGPCARDADLVRAIYAEADGYGTPGHVPPQGYDWSGIRDSSPAAVARMHAVAVKAGVIETPADVTSAATLKS